MMQTTLKTVCNDTLIYFTSYPTVIFNGMTSECHGDIALVKAVVDSKIVSDAQKHSFLADMAIAWNHRFKDQPTEVVRCRSCGKVFHKFHHCELNPTAKGGNNHAA